MRSPRHRQEAGGQGHAQELVEDEMHGDRRQRRERNGQPPGGAERLRDDERDDRRRRDEAEPLDDEDVEQQESRRDERAQAVEGAVLRLRRLGRILMRGEIGLRLLLEAAVRCRRRSSAPQRTRPVPITMGNTLGPTCWPGTGGRREPP